MSCDYNIYCKTCDDIYSFDDANHQKELMQKIINSADVIAELDSLIDSGWEITLTTSYGNIDPAWFKKHKGHNLVPIDEYGIYEMTIEDAFLKIDKCLSKKDKSFFIESELSPDKLAIKQRNLGLWIRNNLGFWSDAGLKKEITKLSGKKHPDDCSHWLIVKYIERLRQENSPKVQ